MTGVGIGAREMPFKLARNLKRGDKVVTNYGRDIKTIRSVKKLPNGNIKILYYNNRYPSTSYPEEQWETIGTKAKNPSSRSRKGFRKTPNDRTPWIPVKAVKFEKGRVLLRTSKTVARSLRAGERLGNPNSLTFDQLDSGEFFKFAPRGLRKYMKLGNDIYTTASSGKKAIEGRPWISLTRDAEKVKVRRVK